MPYPPISTIPNPPNRAQSPATFSADADAFLGDLPAFGEELNDFGDYIDATGVQVDAAYTLGSSALINYKGAYSAGTTYQIGHSVAYLGNFWIALSVNTGVTPAEGVNWTNISIIDGGTF